MRKAILAAVLAFCSLGAAQAAEKIHAYGIADIDNRQITVITRDGVKHRGRQLAVRFDRVTLFHGGGPAELIPESSIAKIEVRQSGRFSRRVLENAVLPLLPFAVCDDCSHRPILLLAIASVPPLLVYSLATTPVLLAADAVAFFIPPKVYEIVP